MPEATALNFSRLLAANSEDVPLRKAILRLDSIYLNGGTSIKPPQVNAMRYNNYSRGFYTKCLAYLSFSSSGSSNYFVGTRKTSSRPFIKEFYQI